ncbi:glycoside hydrolase family 5 protein [Cristinia sonorae]|uniref:glucan 1,3-beta-glucosidase n=1 Tax=Cristinia sonorae TaxID=1940300 RepID=A0A8K0UT72_9AGAR|nr:glycoside hydrolase family 5 protein [Cristinia sonorae]
MAESTDPFLTPNSRNVALNDDNTFIPPNPQFSRNSGIQPSLVSTPRDSTLEPGRNNSYYATPSAAHSNNDVPLLDQQATAAAAVDKREQDNYNDPTPPARTKLTKRPIFWIGIIALVIIVILAVVLPIIFVVVKPHNRAASGPSGASSDNGSDNSNGNSGDGKGGNGGSTRAVVSGGDGSTVTKEDGTTFTYKNPFGGIWYEDPAEPFANGARPNSWTPALNETWQWGVHRINGVNIGGLFVLEPFIVPHLYQSTPGAVDEWTLSEGLRNLPSGNNLTSALEDHYNTFITEEDIAAIAAAGLNWIRLPVPFWAISTWDNVGVDEAGNVVSEPYATGLCWKYILRMFRWARKYGLRIELDLHTAPGSQNGYNHSGKLGSVNFLYGPMGIANAQRMLDYIRIFTEFITQAEYQALIPVFGIMNEALVRKIGKDQVTAFYLQAHDMIREITGIGEGKGPYIAVHDGFLGVTQWDGFLPNSDRIIMDTHPYFAFNGQPNNEPINIPADGDPTQFGGKWPLQACRSWASGMNTSRSNFGITFAGEFSNGFNDCGLFVTGVNGHSASAADCTFYSDWTQWDDNTKKGILNFALASMDALGDYFFWTWKIGASQAGKIESPLWSYELGLREGWMPTDPRKAVGKCASLGGSTSNPFSGVFAPWQTGGAGAGTISAATRAQFPYPPPINGVDVPAAALPTYTATAAMVTLSPEPLPSGVAKDVTQGNGWANAADTAKMAAPVAGCEYPDAWDANDAAIPACAVGGARKRFYSLPTPAAVLRR